MTAWRVVVRRYPGRTITFAILAVCVLAFVAARPSVVDTSLPPAPAAVPCVLFVVLSAPRPIDYATALLRDLGGIDRTRYCYRVMLFESRPDTQRLYLLREFHIARVDARDRVDVPSAHVDKHRDPVERIRWRANEALDYAHVLALALEHASSFPFAVVLEDDVQLGRDFAARLWRIAQEEWQPGDLAWSLLHNGYGNWRAHHHGTPITLASCTQGIVYRAASLGPLIVRIRERYLDDPIDWLIGNYQADTGSIVRQVVPSAVQHIGTRSSLHLKRLETMATLACVAHDFEAPP